MNSLYESLLEQEALINSLKASINTDNTDALAKCEGAVAALASAQLGLAALYQAWYWKRMRESIEEKS